MDVERGFNSEEDYDWDYYVLSSVIHSELFASRQVILMQNAKYYLTKLN